MLPSELIGLSLLAQRRETSSQRRAIPRVMMVEAVRQLETGPVASRRTAMQSLDHTIAHEMMPYGSLHNVDVGC